MAKRTSYGARLLLLVGGLLLLPAACGDTSDGSSKPGGSAFSATQCAQYAECSVDTACAADSGSCLSVDGCDSARCITTEVACEQLCGVGNCVVLESYPGQIACETPVEQEQDAGPDTCADVMSAWQAELGQVQSCESAVDCGQVIEGSSCGCTRSLVARNDADLSQLQALANETREGESCVGFASTCDCPSADGFDCRLGVCTWNYTDTGAGE